MDPGDAQFGQQEGGGSQSLPVERTTVSENKKETVPKATNSTQSNRVHESHREVKIYTNAL